MNYLNTTRGPFIMVDCIGHDIQVKAPTVGSPSTREWQAQVYLLMNQAPATADLRPKRTVSRNALAGVHPDGLSSVYRHPGSGEICVIKARYRCSETVTAH